MVYIVSIDDHCFIVFLFFGLCSKKKQDEKHVLILQRTDIASKNHHRHRHHHHNVHRTYVRAYFSGYSNKFLLSSIYREIIVKFRFVFIMINDYICKLYMLKLKETSFVLCEIRKKKKQNRFVRG